LTDTELRHFLWLLEMRRRAERAGFDLLTELEDFALEMRDSGASSQGIADRIGMSKTTVANWSKAAERRRNA